ncbi:hypothetical protein QWI17_12345 [Gilvimarinus sp. SDUM040013]|uniref:Uncharacterized protein n=1 Tax=Gilvimarinus gilvus TaxID=3058038 RepID=A0ABU4RXD3_9GAMM|nr:hypothetical protein [Gilvimarinus sp. SDUM040013]MDO3386628.1 hypothetical protein [Gilvimarinus sp. SDUM040013]MDX6849485.1 hypothetical protein [Gilvimarinus sp. SDUM040013]
MNKLGLLSSLIISSSILAGCGSEPDSSAPDIIINIENPDPGTGGGDGGDGGSDLPTITNTALPILEDFSAADTQTFFTSGYRALASDAEDGENGFYYSMAGVFMEDGTVDMDGGNWITADNDQKMRLGDSRFTIGQTVSPLAGDVADPRKDSTPGDGIDEGLSWGELDLTQDYRISFCVVAVPDTASSSDFQIYVDNNTTSEASSIHGGGNVGSRIFNQPVNNLVPGQRVEINIPGDTTLQAGGELVGSKPDLVGTENSFFSFRVSSGGWAVFDDLVIEYQSESNGDSQPDCSTKDSIYKLVNPITGGDDNNAPVEPNEGTPFTGLPLTLDFSADAETFFGENDEADFLSISSNREDPFYKVTSGSSRITIENNQLSLNNARFTIGDTGVATADGVTPSGNMDLSRPYRIKMMIEDFTSADPADPGKFQVYIDNNTTSSGNSIHGGDSKFSEITPDDVTSLPYELVLEPDLGTTTSFLQVRADSRVGNLSFSEFTIEYLDADGEGWTPYTLNLAGSSDIAPAGEVTENTDTAVTLSATGGNMSSSNHNLYFAGKMVEMSDFMFTAQISNITGADVGAGNAYRFGIMIMENMDPVADYADLAGWADAGFYVDGDPAELIGSRAQMKPSGSRSRSNISELEVGDYVRIEIYDDGDGKRLKRYYSKNGVDFEQANSTSDFKATPESDSWYVGLYAAPGENNITIEFDNILVEEIAP